MSPVAEPDRGEPSVALPVRPLIAAMAGITVAVPLVYAAIVVVAGRDRATIESAAWGSALAGGIAAGATLIMGPWNSRPIASWMTLWLAATVLRLFVTPVAAWLLYSATSLDLEALCLAVASTYFLTVLTEAWMIARHVKRFLPPR